jgi:hypothetical protein
MRGLREMSLRGMFGGEEGWCKGETIFLLVGNVLCSSDTWY